jgi:hypothetical protein
MSQQDRMADYRKLVDNWYTGYMRLVTEGDNECLSRDLDEEIDLLCNFLHGMWKRKQINKKEYQETAGYCRGVWAKFEIHVREIAKGDEGWQQSKCQT